MLLRKHKSTRNFDLALPVKYCFFGVPDCTGSKTLLFCPNNSQTSFCEIGSGLVRHLNVYSGFEFLIVVNIRVGYGGNSLRGGSAMKHERACCQHTRKRIRQNEVWHFIIRDEGLEQQTMHFKWHTSMSCTVKYNSRSEM